MTTYAEEVRSSDGVSGLFDVTGRTVVITGGASGLGRMIAEGFVAGGARVVLVSRDRSSAERAVAAMQTRGRCEWLVGDVATAEGVDALAGEVLDRYPIVDVLVNNAGATWMGSLRDHPDAAFDAVWAVNVKAVFRLTMGLLPALRAAAAATGEPARVVTIGSIDGMIVPDGPNCAYGASKAAVHHLTRYLARELAEDGVTVNAIAPGLFETAMTAPLLAKAGEPARMTEAIPLRRLGRPDDIASAVIYLASRAGSFVTGAVIPVDGGESGCGPVRA